jgi:hypothetical protein
MSWSLNIGTIAGTAVRVHITFLLFLGWIFFANYVAEGPGAATVAKESRPDGCGLCIHDRIGPIA